jgi:hypothetical protein
MNGLSNLTEFPLEAEQKHARIGSERKTHNNCWIVPCRISNHSEVVVHYVPILESAGWIEAKLQHFRYGNGQLPEPARPIGNQRRHRTGLPVDLARLSPYDAFPLLTL